jgi:glycosyltransferase involved in cell wall biosynthesis
VSVVIAVRDAPEVEQTLERLAPQVDAAGAECLVIDASGGRLTAIAARHPEVRWIDHPTSLDGSISIAAQRNAGIRAARGRVIAFIDAGCEPVDGWLTALTAPLLAGDTELACGPIRSRRPGVYTLINDHPDGTRIAPTPTGNLALARSLFERIGGFDTRFAYGSDTDWTLRAAEAGVMARVVRAAEVVLDFGPKDLSARRSFRYGRGRTRMLRFHPDRLGAQLRRQPDYLIYPAYLLGLPFAIAAGFAASPLVLLAYAALLAIPLLRHRAHPAPLDVLGDHLVQGAGVLTELASAVVPPAPTVLHFPFDPGPYQGPLNRALAEVGVRGGILRGPTPFQSLNVALLPLSLLSARLRGARVWHLHWTWGFLPGARVPRIVRRVCRAWFGTQLSLARRLGLRLVWTAHNLLPHQPVFDDDVTARRTLLAAADAVVVHHAQTAVDLATRFGALPPVTVAVQGCAELPPLPPREAARTALDLPAERLALVFTGRILPYKGLLELFAALAQVHPEERGRLALRIAGEVEPASHRTELETAAAALPDLDIAFEWGRISDERYAAYLAGADLALFPFRSITNSGSVITALGAGTPALIAGHPTLAGLPEPAVLRYDPARGVEGLREALREALARTSDDWQAARDATARFAAGATWDAAARAHRALYAQLLGGER